MQQQRNIRRTGQDWQSIFNTFSDSGLTQEQFCRQYQLAPSTFAKWKKQLGMTSSSVSQDFVEVQPVPATAAPDVDGPRLELTISVTRRFQLHLKIV